MPLVKMEIHSQIIDNDTIFSFATRKKVSIACDGGIYEISTNDWHKLVEIKRRNQPGNFHGTCPKCGMRLDGSFFTP